MDQRLQNALIVLNIDLKEEDGKLILSGEKCAVISIIDYLVVRNKAIIKIMKDAALGKSGSVKEAEEKLAEEFYLSKDAVHMIRYNSKMKGHKIQE